MKTVYYVKSDTCSRCQQLYEPTAKKALQLWYNFTEVPFESSEVQITSVPTVYIKGEDGIEKVLEFEGIVERINSKEENSDDLPF